MTYREKAKTDLPEYVDDMYDGGVCGCPWEYGYEKKTECIGDCTACWDRECPDTPLETTRAAENALKVMLDPGAKMPTRAHEADAGLDLYAPEDVKVPGCVWVANTAMKASVGAVKVGTAVIDTGVHVEIPVGYVGMVKSKSGLNINENITSEGVIDSGYTGSIRVKLYNHGANVVEIKKGQKISQLVILPIITPVPVVVDSLDETERGNGGFGSTGKF